MKKKYLTFYLLNFSNALLLRLSLLAMILFISFNSFAQNTYYWRNDQNPPANANWSTTSPQALWWIGVPAVPTGAEVLVFNGSSTNMTSNNDLPNTNRFNITFDNSPPVASRTLNGSLVNTFYDYSSNPPSIVNNDAVSHTINFPFLNGNSTGTNRLEIIANSSGFVFGSAIGASGGTRNLVAIGNNNLFNIFFNGVISDGTGTLNFLKEGVNTSVLGGANTYTGTTRVTGGMLSLSGSGTFGVNSRVFISNSATLNLNNVNATVQSVEETASGNSGSVSLGSGTLTVLGGYGVGVTRYQGTIYGSGGLTKQGTGTMALFGGQVYTGITTVSGGELSSSVNMSSTSYLINGGLFRIAAANILPDAANVTMSSGTFAVDNSETINDLNMASGGTLTVAAGATLTINGTFTGGLGNITNNGTIVFAAGSTVSSFPGSGTVIINNLTANTAVTLNNSLTVSGLLSIGNANTFSLNGNNLTTAQLSGGNASSSITNGHASAVATLTVNGAVASSFPGILANGGAAALNIAKSGAGNFTIGGNNTYTGSTAISAGSLTATSNNALPTNNNINISNNAILALGAGFAGTKNLGILNIASGGSLDVGGAGAVDVHFADAHLLSWTGTFTILNWTPVASKNIYFNVQGLSATQLSNFNFDGYGIGAKFEGLTDKVVPRYLYITNGTGGGNFSVSASWQNGDNPLLNTGVESIFIKPGDVLTQDQNYNLFSANVSGTYAIGAYTINITGGAAPGIINNIGTVSIGASGIINLGIGGTFNNSGTVSGLAGSAINFNAGGGLLTHSGSPVYSTTTTINFPGTGTVSGIATLPVVNISGAVNFGTGSTIGTSLIINTTGSVVTNAPKYGTASTLYYYQSGTANRGLEWTGGTSSTASAGYPNDVIIGNGIAATNLNLNNNIALQMGGSLTVAASSSLLMNDNTTPQDLSVVKNVVINGTLTLGNIVTGPPQYIADLIVGGNFTRNTGAVFNPNQRGVFFNGTANQTIDGAGAPITFAYFIVNNAGTAGNNAVKFINNTDAVIDAGIGGYSFQMLNGNLDLNGRTLLFRTYTYGSVNQVYIDGTAGNLTRQVISSVNPGTFNFTNTDASQRTTTIVRKNAGTASLLSFSPDVVVNIFASGAGGSGVDFGAGLSTINGTLQINPNTFVSTNPPYYGNSSSVPAAAATLIYQSGGTYIRSAEWNTAVTTAPGYANNVIVRNGTTLNFTGTTTFDVGCAGNLSIGHTNSTTGIVDLGTIGTDLYVGGDVVIGGNTGSSTLKLSGTFGGDIYIAGGWNRTANGVINFGAGNGRAVFFNGSSNGTITANGGETFPYVYLVKNTKTASVTLADNITITDEIGLTQGTFDLAAKNVTIKSTALKTARVSESSSANTVLPYSGTGRFVIERNAGALRSWRLLTAPINSSQTIRAAWMEGAVPSTTSPLFNSDPVPGYGTHITGNLPAINNFDQNSTTNYSIKYFNAGSWFGVPNTGVDITSQKGFMLFIRGDRSYSISTTTNLTTPATTTLRTTGKINIGDMPAIVPSGFTVVGNPYASAINFSSITKTPSARANDIFYVWDPKITSGTTSTTVGGWITLTRDGTGTNYLASPTPVSNTIDLTTGRIESGAAIMVNAANLTSISIKETDKSAANALVFRPSGPQAGALTKMLRTNFYVKNNDGSLALFDGTLQLFDSHYSNDVDGADAIKLSNFSENFSIISQSKLLSIEKRLPLSFNDTILYDFKQPKLRNYSIELDPFNIAANNLAGYVEDNYLHKTTPMNMDALTRVDFTVSNDAGSYAPDRLRIVFKQLIQYNNLTATPINSDINIDWEVASEFNINRYEIERSENGNDFTTAGTITCAADNNHSKAYHWLDVKPAPGKYWYRIKCISNNNVIAYSNAVKVALARQSQSMYVFPNPVTEKSINLYMNTMPGGIYTARLLNAAGQVLQSKNINHKAGTPVEIISIDNHLAKGSYQLEIIHAGRLNETLKVIVL